MEYIVAVIIILGGIYAYLVTSLKKDLKRDKMSFKESIDLTDLPIITFYNNGKKFNFLLDTGASTSVMDSSVLPNLVYKEKEERGTLYGMEGNEIDTAFISVSLSYKDKEYEDTFHVVDMSAPFNKIKADYGVTLSGILGSLFFYKYQYVLDFKELAAYSMK